MNDPAPHQESFETISVIIPTFNEPGIAGTVSALAGEIPGAEIIVVDDGSDELVDPSLSELPHVRVIYHPHNRGYGAALKTGMRASTRPIVCWYDGDGQHRPSDLRAVVDAIGKTGSGEVDACIGMRQTSSFQTMNRMPGKFLLHWIAQILIGTAIPDLNSGLRVFRREVIERYYHLLPDGFSASTTSTLLMVKRGYRLMYIPIKTMPRTGESTVRILQDGLGTLRLILNIVMLFDAFKVFGLLSLLQLAVGSIYGLWMSLIVGRGFPILAAVILLSGVITFFVALLADQISAMRQERFEHPPR